MNYTQCEIFICLIICHVFTGDVNAGRQMKNICNQFIVIAGPPRSGTTLLNRILCSSMECSPVVPECSFLTKQIEMYAHTILFADEERFSCYYGNRQVFYEIFRKSFNLHLECLLKTRPDIAKYNHIILKDPLLSLYLKYAIDIFPDDTRFIITIRNPLGVIASIKNVVRKQKKKWELELRAADIFNYYHQIVLFLNENKKNVYFIKYEDIVERKLSDLEKYVGFNIDGLIDNDKKICIWDKSDPFYTLLNDADISQERILSWRTELSDDEIIYIKRSFSGMLDYFGYSD